MATPKISVKISAGDLSKAFDDLGRHFSKVALNGFNRLSPSPAERIVSPIQGVAYYPDLGLFEIDGVFITRANINWLGKMQSGALLAVERLRLVEGGPHNSIDVIGFKDVSANLREMVRAVRDAGDEK